MQSFIEDTFGKKLLRNQARGDLGTQQKHANFKITLQNRPIWKNLGVVSKIYHVYKFDSNFCRMLLEAINNQHGEMFG